MDSALIGTLSALGGALAAGAFALLGAWLQSRRAHEAWIRERRYDAFVTVQTMLNEIQSYDHEVAEIQRAVSEAESKVQAAEAKSKGEPGVVAPPNLVHEVRRLETRNKRVQANVGVLREQFPSTTALLSILGPDDVSESVGIMNALLAESAPAADIAAAGDRLTAAMQRSLGIKSKLS